MTHKKFVCEIREVENGYVISLCSGNDARNGFSPPLHVAGDPDELADLICMFAKESQQEGSQNEKSNSSRAR